MSRTSNITVSGIRLLSGAFFLAAAFALPSAFAPHAIAAEPHQPQIEHYQPCSWGAGPMTLTLAQIVKKEQPIAGREPKSDVGPYQPTPQPPSAKQLVRADDHGRSLDHAVLQALAMSGNGDQMDRRVR